MKLECESQCRTQTGSRAGTWQEYSVQESVKEESRVPGATLREMSMWVGFEDLFQLSRQLSCHRFLGFERSSQVTELPPCPIHSSSPPISGAGVDWQPGHSWGMFNYPFQAQPVILYPCSSSFSLRSVSQPVIPTSAGCFGGWCHQRSRAPLWEISEVWRPIHPQVGSTQALVHQKLSQGYCGLARTLSKYSEPQVSNPQRASCSHAFFGELLKPADYFHFFFRLMLKQIIIWCGSNGGPRTAVFSELSQGVGKGIPEPQVLTKHMAWLWATVQVWTANTLLPSRRQVNSWYLSASGNSEPGLSQFLLPWVPVSWPLGPLSHFLFGSLCLWSWWLDSATWRRLWTP